MLRHWVTIPGYPATHSFKNVSLYTDIELDYIDARSPTWLAGHRLSRGSRAQSSTGYAGHSLRSVSRGSQKCLDVFGALIDDAAGVIQWGFPGNANQAMEAGAGGEQRYPTACVRRSRTASLMSSAG